MDEPTASLSEREVERLFGVIARLESEGVGIIYISHRLEEISRWPIASPCCATAARSARATRDGLRRLDADPA